MLGTSTPTSPTTSATAARRQEPWETALLQAVAALRAVQSSNLSESSGPIVIRLPTPSLSAPSSPSASPLYTQQLVQTLTSTVAGAATTVAGAAGGLIRTVSSSLSTGVDLARSALSTATTYTTETAMSLVNAYFAPGKEGFTIGADLLEYLHKRMERQLEHHHAYTKVLLLLQKANALPEGELRDNVLQKILTHCKTIESAKEGSDASLNAERKTVLAVLKTRAVTDETDLSTSLAYDDLVRQIIEATPTGSHAALKVIFDNLKESPLSDSLESVIAAIATAIPGDSWTKDYELRDFSVHPSAAAFKDISVDNKEVYAAVLTLLLNLRLALDNNIRQVPATKILSAADLRELGLDPVTATYADLLKIAFPTNLKLNEHGSIEGSKDENQERVNAKLAVFLLEHHNHPDSEQFKYVEHYRTYRTFYNGLTSVRFWLRASADNIHPDVLAVSHVEYLKAQWDFAIDNCKDVIRTDVLMNNLVNVASHVYNNLYVNEKNYCLLFHKYRVLSKQYQESSATDIAGKKMLILKIISLRMAMRDLELEIAKAYNEMHCYNELISQCITQLVNDLKKRTHKANTASASLSVAPAPSAELAIEALPNAFTEFLTRQIEAREHALTGYLLAHKQVVVTNALPIGEDKQLRLASAAKFFEILDSASDEMRTSADASRALLLERLLSFSKTTAALPQFGLFQFKPGQFYAVADSKRFDTITSDNLSTYANLITALMVEIGSRLNSAVPKTLARVIIPDDAFLRTLTDFDLETATFGDLLARSFPKYIETNANGSTGGERPYGAEQPIVCARLQTALEAALQGAPTDDALNHSEYYGAYSKIKSMLSVQSKFSAMATRAEPLNEEEIPMLLDPQLIYLIGCFHQVLDTRYDYLLLGTFKEFATKLRQHLYEDENAYWTAFCNYYDLMIKNASTPSDRIKTNELINKLVKLQNTIIELEDRLRSSYDGLLCFTRLIQSCSPQLVKVLAEKLNTLNLELKRRKDAATADITTEALTGSDERLALAMAARARRAEAPPVATADTPIGFQDISISAGAGGASSMPLMPLVVGSPTGATSRIAGVMQVTPPTSPVRVAAYAPDSDDVYHELP